MKIIKVEKVVIKDFKSYLEAEVDITGPPGFCYLGGVNTAEVALGSNGAGKSTFFDALHWCLYGSITKGGRISSLVSWGKEEAKVTAYLDVSGSKHVITRQGPPVKAYLDEQLVEQPAIDILLGLSKDRFDSAVIFSQTQKLFSDWSIPERGDLLDEVLGLGLWQRCSEKASQRSSELEKEAGSKKTELSYIQGQLASLPSADSLKLQVTTWDASRDAAVARLLAAFDSWHRSNEMHLNRLREISASWDSENTARILQLTQEEAHQKEVWLAEVDKIAQELSVEEQKLSLLQNASDAAEQLIQSIKQDKAASELTVQTSQKEFNDLLLESGGLFSQRTALERDILWWETSGSSCLTCKQRIGPGTKVLELIELEAKLKVVKNQQLENEKASKAKKEALQVDNVAVYRQVKREAAYESDKSARFVSIHDLNTKINNLRRQALDLLEKVEQPENDYTRKISEAKNATNPNLGLITSIEFAVNPNLVTLQQEQQKINPYLVSVLENEANRTSLNARLEEKQEEIDKLSNDRVAVDYWKQGFKNIRLFFVEKVLTALQIEIRSAMSTLGLKGWQVQLATETETKSGTLKLGVQIQVSSPKSQNFVVWESWSGGETQRLRLAMAMGLASLIQRAGGVWWDIEIWDEPSAWLSVEGIEDLLEAFEYRAQSQQKRLWIVDHSALTYSGFSEMWCVIKDEQGSHLQKMKLGG